MTPDQIVSAVRAHLDRIEEVAKRADYGFRWRQLDSDEYGPKVAVGTDEDAYWQREVNYQIWHCDDEQDGCPEIARGWIAEAKHIALHDPSSVLSLTAAIRKLLAEYEECRAYYEANPKDPAGEVLGFWTSIEILAQGLGIDTEEKTS